MKLRKMRGLSVVLTAAMVMSMFSGIQMSSMAAGETTGKPDYSIEWYNTSDSTFVLDSAEELAGLAAIVNGEAATEDGKIQDDFENKTIVLDADINLNNVLWEPIGDIDVNIVGESTYTDVYKVETENAFAGTFDGSGHTISGLNCSDEAGGVALFGYVTGTLKNFTVEGKVAGKHVTAGVAAYASGILSNITNKAQVVAEGNCVGGVVGDASGNIIITGCRNEGEVTNNNAASEKSTGRVAGIIGRIDTQYTASITECSNAGDITGYQYVGGIAGGVFGDVTVDSCYNTGDLEGISFGKVYLGGIVGQLMAGTVSNCYNTGDIYDSHWHDGHIRSVGGIVGSEEGHLTGTAISNCYTTGKITLNTSNMTLGRYFVYMVGNISGGNIVSGENEMSYDNCYYLENRIEMADPEHESYPYWSDVYKNNPLAYDTKYITSVTRSELKGDEILTKLGEYFAYDENSVNNGYPVLYWQTNQKRPNTAYSVTSVSVKGGTAEASVSEKTAFQGTEILVKVADVEEGKQVSEVIVLDAAGIKVPVTNTSEGYSFAMPERNVTITVYLENKIAEDAEPHKINMPSDLDAVWDVKVVDSNNYDAETGMMKEGATVTITVTKAQKAETTDFTGITVMAGDSKVDVAENESKSIAGAKWYGEYSFTMPESDVSVAVDITYKEIAVYEKHEDISTKTASLTRAEMLALAEKNKSTYYSGWETEYSGFVGIADVYVTLEQLLSAAGLVFEPGDSVMVTGSDGMNMTFTYESLIATPRYYYPGILTKDDSVKQPVDAMFVIKGNTVESAEALETVVTDTLYAYKFAFGQSEEDFNSQKKIVDQQLKTISKVTLIKAVSEEEDATKSVSRVSGANRYATALKAADELKATLGVDQFDTVIVATGKNFADALAGSYLATVTDAPILLIEDAKADMVTDYIKENVKKGGTVYVLGGTAAVSEKSISTLVKYNVKRLSGTSRYETNLAILAAAKAEGGNAEDLLVCTGKNFADSLSASATGRPVLLVGDSISDAQAKYLAEEAYNNYYIIGGTGAVNADIEDELKAIGSVERLSGKTRFNTSILVAEEFFQDPDTAVVASALNYPDGLCGGPLAAKLNVPLILSAAEKEAAAAEYVEKNDINNGIVLGGASALSDDAVRAIFGLEADIEIIAE